MELRRGRGADQVRRGGVSRRFHALLPRLHRTGETLSDISPEQYERRARSTDQGGAGAPSAADDCARCAPQIARVASQRGSRRSSAGCLAGQYADHHEVSASPARGRIDPRVPGDLAARTDPAPSPRRSSNRPLWDVRLPLSSAAVAAREPSPSPETSPARTRGARTGPSAAPPRWGSTAPATREARAGEPNPTLRPRPREAGRRAARRRGLTEITVDELTATSGSVGRRLPFHGRWLVPRRRLAVDLSLPGGGDLKPAPG